MMRKACLGIAMGAALAAAGCVPTKPQRTIGFQPSNKIWARADGQRMSGNAGLMRQGQADLQQCRALASVDGRDGQYDLKILNGCMESRGYVERDL